MKTKWSVNTCLKSGWNKKPTSTNSASNFPTPQNFPDLSGCSHDTCGNPTSTNPSNSIGFWLWPLQHQSMPVLLLVSQFLEWSLANFLRPKQKAVWVTRFFLVGGGHALFWHWIWNITSKSTKALRKAVRDASISTFWKMKPECW